MEWKGGGLARWGLMRGERGVGGLGVGMDLAWGC